MKRSHHNFRKAPPYFSLQTLTNVFVGISSLFALTCPILFTPIVADDFFNPLYQLSRTGGGYWSSLEYGVSSAWNGASLRIVGNAVGALANNVQTDFSGRLGIPFGFTFGLIKFIGFLALATALTYYLKAVLIQAGSVWKSYSPVFIINCVLIGSTMQIHALWSNDPVAGYPLPGTYTAAFSIFLLGLATQWSPVVTWKKVLTLSILAIALLLYYELTFFIAPLISMLIIRAGWKKRVKFDLLLKSIVPTAMVFFVVVLSRLKTSSNVSEYGGSTLRGGSRVISETLLSFVSSMPSAGWHLSSENVSFSQSLRPYSFAVVVLSALAFMLSVIQINNTQRASSKRNLVWAILPVVAIGLSATLLQSSTVKVQDEINRVGQVYTFYPSVIAIFVLGTAVLIISLIDFRKILTMMLLSLALFAGVQNTFNWGLLDKMNSVLIPNRSLISTLGGNVEMLTRCDNLRAWSGGNWPDYYEIGVIDGLNQFADLYWADDYCAHFIRPD